MVVININGDIYSDNGPMVKNGICTYLFAANDSQLVGTWDMNNLKPDDGFIKMVHHGMVILKMATIW